VSVGDNYLINLIRVLAQRGIVFLVAGGAAAVLHGVQRLTLDLDIALDMTAANIERFLETVREIGLRPRAPVPASLLADPVARAQIVAEKKALVFSFIDPDRPHRQIDVFITEHLSYRALIGHCEPHDLHGDRVWVLSKEALLAEKRSLEEKREQDLLDIEALTEMLHPMP